MYSSLWAQQLTLSPYSRYGVGDIINNGTVRNASMGGIGMATGNYFSVNRLNPASYADAAFTTFDISGFAYFNQLKTQEKSENQSSAGFQNIAFMFPSNKNFTLAFGFAPFSVVGYDITSLRLIDANGIDGIERIQYKADGGLNQVFLGGGFRMLKQRLRFGWNFLYTFGGTRYTRITSIPEDSPIIAAHTVTLTDQTYLTGFGGQVGLMFVDSLKSSDLYLRIGAMAEFNGELKGSRLMTSDNVVGLDTLINEEGAVSIPTKYGIGVHLSRPGKWAVGADVSMQNWEQFTYFSNPTQLSRELVIAVGGELTPNFTSTNYLERISYRIGGYAKRSYIAVGGESVNDVGFTLGVGLPASQQGTNQYNRARLYSKISLGVAVGKRGNLSINQPLEEFYARVRIGITLNDTWFIRRVVD
ncbi:MAG: hypothetical protein D6730_13870 [Bacteroidetes bacterium]|nr:MAG: hypothetical protein D6730_13870 [Bacteroidota bacterium]